MSFPILSHPGLVTPPSPLLSAPRSHVSIQFNPDSVLQMEGFRSRESQGCAQSLASTTSLCTSLYRAKSGPTGLQ